MFQKFNKWANAQSPLIQYIITWLSVFVGASVFVWVIVGFVTLTLYAIVPLGLVATMSWFLFWASSVTCIPLYIQRRQNSF